MDKLEQSEQGKSFALTLRKNFRPFVEMMVLDSKGKLLDRRAMNADIINRFPKVVPPTPELEAHFLKFLETH